ncbi:MAG: VCBS repeat-containing protein [Enhygromyxa sp.]
MKRRLAPQLALFVAPLLWVTPGCTVDVRVILDGDEGGDEGPLETGDDQASDEGDDQADEGPGLADLPADTEPEPQPLCQIPSDELDGNLPCGLEPPSDQIAPVVAWTWTGPGGEDSVLTTPLVANLDDDNGDGFVDLCDTPDIVVAAVDLPPGKSDLWPAGHLHVIAGDGSGSFVIPTPIDAAINPALGDLDGDGVPELVAAQALAPNSPYAISERRLVALSAAGELLWTGEHLQASRGGGAIALADLDGDGSPEILAPEYVATAEGALAWTIPNPPLSFSMPVAVDLDLDGELEVLFGASAYTADGTWLFTAGGVPQNRGSVAVANFDDDPHPEIYMQFDGQHGVFDHEGTLTALCPTAAIELAVLGGYPVAVHDLDGDGRAELVFGLQSRFFVLGVEDGSCSLRWSEKVDTDIGSSSGTVFDLLGDGTAEAIYADRSRVQLFSDTGELLFVAPRSARESITNPIVADVDGDGAAEIVIVSSEPVAGEAEDASPSPTLLVLENADDRLAPTRRVWNQHTYHHSNISEGARVPVEEAPHWLLENSFRSNSPTESGDSCIPPALRANGR